MASNLKQSKTSSDERPTGGNPPTGGRGMYYRQGIKTLKLVWKYQVFTHLKNKINQNKYK